MSDSTIDAKRDVLVTASSTIAVEAITIAAAITAGSGDPTQTPEKGTFTISGAGAGSGNSITNTVEASISNAKDADPTKWGILADGGVYVHATDKSSIKADAGGFALALTLSTSGKFKSVAIGLAAAENRITNSVDAFVRNSTVKASGALHDIAADGVRVEVVGTPTIQAPTIAGALAATGAGTGAGSGNYITQNARGRTRRR